jgi:hypothetical protein
MKGVVDDLGSGFMRRGITALAKSPFAHSTLDLSIARIACPSLLYPLPTMRQALISAELQF